VKEVAKTGKSPTVSQSTFPRAAEIQLVKKLLQSWKWLQEQTDDSGKGG